MTILTLLTTNERKKIPYPKISLFTLIAQIAENKTYVSKIKRCFGQAKLHDSKKTEYLMIIFLISH